MGAQDVLLRIDGVQLFQVVGQQQTLLRQGSFTIQYDMDTDFTNLMAQVEDVAWSLSASTATLKVTETVYTVALEGVTQYYYCIVLPPGLSEEVLEATVNILSSTTVYQQLDVTGQAAATAIAATAAPPAALPAQLPGEAPPAGAELKKSESKLARQIEAGGATLGAAITKLGEMTAVGIHKASQYAVSKTTPNEKPTEISPKNQERMKSAVKLAAAVAAVAGAASHKVGEVAGAVATRVGSNVAPNTLKREDSTTRQVVSAGATAFLAVWDALEDAALLVLRQSGRAASVVISHKYGVAAGGSAADLAKMGEHAYVSYTAVRRLTAKGILKGVAKKTAKAVVMPATGSPRTGSPAAAPSRLASVSAAPAAAGSQAAAPAYASMQTASVPYKPSSPGSSNSPSYAPPAYVPPAVPGAAPAGAGLYTLPPDVEPLLMATPIYPATRPAAATHYPALPQ